MNLTAVSHLGCTLIPGSRASGSSYASHSQLRERTSCWMELVCFDGFPEVPSLSGTMVQQRSNLLESTRGAGKPECTLRIEIELFDDECPKTCANFRHLCAGQSTSRQRHRYIHQDLTPCYRGTYFHKIYPRFGVQGGDLTMRVDKGANHFSSFGRGWFADEYKRRHINKAGFLLMANNGPNSNGSQFFITTSETEEKAVNGRHVCFGRITYGLVDFLREVGSYGDINGHPSRFVIIVDCGVGPMPDTFEATDTDPNTVNNSVVGMQAAGTETEQDEGHTTSTDAFPNEEEQTVSGNQEVLRNNGNATHVSFMMNQ